MRSSLMLKDALLISGLSVSWMLGANTAVNAESPGEHALTNHTISYVTYWNQWAVYQSKDGKEECPQGLGKWGPRERFKALYPDDDVKRTVKDTRLALAGALWNPPPGPNKFPYLEAGGATAYGLNLDGRVGPHDFTSPDGEKGVDDQLYRVIGCNENYRGPNGVIYTVGEIYFRNRTFNRIMIELTNVDNLQNDPEVDVTITRGLDDLLTDAAGDHVLPGGTQRLDRRWTKKFEQHVKGKIVNGVLITEPAAAIEIPNARNRKPVAEIFRGGRFKLKLTPDYAEGIVAGYVDINRFYYNYNREFTDIEIADGHEDPLGTYKKLTELADAYPDPKTGANTAISGAMLIKFEQTFVARPEDEVLASKEEGMALPTGSSKTTSAVLKAGKR